MKKAALFLTGGLVALAALVIVPGLWRQGFIDLPPVAVRGIGRVAGVMSVRGSMDVQLPVTFHRQEHSLSCEIATLKMALGNYGVDIPEAELIAQMPYDTTAKGGGVWGDPNVGFVGDIDGKMLIDGYGVYWDPIAKVGLRHKRTEVLRNSTAAVVAGHLLAGRPVIVWGYYGRYQAFNWRTADGENIQAVNGEHTRVVTGFRGTADAPTHFSLIDPIDGKLTWTVEKFMENWTSLGRHGVVVYPHPRWVRAVDDTRVWEISADGTTRHWVRSPEDLEASGGFAGAVKVIDNKELLRYKQGSDVVI